MADEKERKKKESTVIKIIKMVRDALFSPSPQDELYKPSTFYQKWLSSI